MKLLGRAPGLCGGCQEGGETIAQVGLMLGKHMTCTSIITIQNGLAALLPAGQSSYRSSFAALHMSNSKASSIVHYLYTIQGVVLDLSISSKSFPTFPFVIIQVALATLHACCQQTTVSDHTLE